MPEARRVGELNRRDRGPPLAHPAGGYLGCPANSHVYNLPKVYLTIPYQLTTQVNCINSEMESLLSLSFDYLSSYDGVKIRKGLRQLEGLLAQICLSRTPADRRSSVISNGASKQTTKELSLLKDDPAFRDFFKLQEGFEWNGTPANRPCPLLFVQRWLIILP